MTYHPTGVRVDQFWDFPTYVTRLDYLNGNSYMWRTWTRSGGRRFLYNKLKKDAE